MERLPLLTANSERRSFRRQLRVYVGEEDFGPACRVSRRVITEGLFTSLEEHFPEVKVSSTRLAQRQITADNPYLTAGQRERLDERGVIRAGSVVRKGDVLVSIVETPSKGKACNYSHETPPECDGANVRQVVYRTRDELGRNAPDGVDAIVSLELVANRELEIGDLLAIDDESMVVSGVVEQPPLDSGGAPADLVLSAAVGQRLQVARGTHTEQAVGKANARAALALEVRSTGPYSLITMQPLRRSCPGQPLTLPQVAWLQERGLTGILGELAGVKSDNLVARAELRQALVNGSLDEFPDRAAGACETLAVVALMLRSLGLNVKLKRGSGCISLALAPATSQELIAASAGQILKPETINYRTYDDEPGGIFCPKVFGESSATRRRQFAHLPLPMPVISPIWRLGTPSLLEQWLGLSAEQIEGILTCQVNVAVRGDEVHLAERNSDEPAETGGAAIRTLLARVPPERLPPTLRGRTEAIAPDVALILPPDLRPIVLLDSGNFATSDLNDLLRRLINRRNRLVKLAELKAPQIILDNEQRMLQGCLDELHANSILPKRDAALGAGNRPLKCTLGIMAGFLQDNDKRVEWAGRARVIIDASVASGCACIPRAIFHELRLADCRPILLTAPEGSAWAACLPQPHEANVIVLSPATAAALELPRDQPAECLLHRPIGTAARAETEQLLKHGPPRHRDLAPRSCWATASSPQQLAAQLAAAAASGDAISFDTPQLLLVGGCGSIDLTLADDSPAPS